MATESPTSSNPSPHRQSPLLVSPTKRLKTIIQQHSHPPQQQEHDNHDEPEQTPIDSDSNLCGICLSKEGGVSIRGWIDSCDHYFCFVCIMEWAKVESKCPLCKGRFSTIRRPPKPPVFLSQRIVRVPVRDQVYHYFGNATVGPPDPYSEVRCSVCLGVTHESLLLLCDLCDSASHTYCVGLGHTVPEGDWFCPDCTVLRAEHAKNDTDTNDEERTSVFDVLRESNTTEAGSSSTTAASYPTPFSSCVVDSGAILPDNITTGHATEVGARTLRRCRNVHDRIQALRANWNAFRSGSLTFSCSSVNNGDCADEKRDTGTGPRGRSGLTNPASCSSQQLTARKGSSKGSSPDMLRNGGSHDIDKAWKMMAVAKSFAQGHKKSSMRHQASKHPSRKVNTSKKPIKMTSRILDSNSKQVGTQNLGNTGLEKHYQYHSLPEDNNGHKSQMFQKHKQNKVTMKGIPKLGEGSPTTCSPGYGKLPSSKVHTSVDIDVRHCGGEIPEQILVGAPSKVYNKRGGSCVNSPVASLPVALNISHSKRELCTTSSTTKMEPPGEKCRIGKGTVESKARRDEAKVEIQSLVRLNLTILSGNKLEVNVFKEIARLATHSIMVACDLEHLKPGVVPTFPTLVCYHDADFRQNRRSTLMPGSCRECFYIFVKDVVNSIMCEKTG